MSKENEKKRQGYFVDERRGREDMSMNSVQDIQNLILEACQWQ